MHCRPFLNVLFLQFHYLFLRGMIIESKREPEQESTPSHCYQTSQSGGFYSAEDADSLPKPDSEHKKEGAFCVWKHEEITQLLSGPVTPGHQSTLAEVFCHHYSVAEGGNVNPYQVSSLYVQFTYNCFAAFSHTC